MLLLLILGMAVVPIWTNIVSVPPLSRVQFSRFIIHNNNLVYDDALKMELSRTSFLSLYSTV